MKFYTLLLLLIGVGQLAFGQQSPHYTMFMLNKHKLNPAYAGFDESLSATGVYRQQWSGLTGAPEQVNLNIHMPMFIIGGGIGLNLDNEKSGALINSRAEISYSYWLDLSRDIQMAIGVRAGINQLSIDGSVLRAPEGVYEPGINHNDPLIPVSKVSSGSPVLGLGVHLKAAKWNGGISMENVVETKSDFNLSQDQLSYGNARHILGYADYQQDIGMKFQLKPAVLLRSDLIQHEFHFAALMEYDSRFLGGVAYRGFNSETNDAFTIIIGAFLNDNLSLGYSYDITLSPLSSISRGSHEILLNYNLKKPIGKGKIPNIIYNPRF